METATSSSNANARVVVKLSYAGEMHRMTLDQSDLTFDALCALVPQTFVQPTPKSYALVYTDNEGDLVTVSSALELNEAFRVLLDLNGERKTMHFRVLPRVSVKDQIPPAVLQAVDELSSTISRLASDTRESLSQSTYLERGRASVAYSAKQTREFLESARKEIAQRLKDVQARIVGEIERRRSSVSSADEAAAVAVATTFEEQLAEAIGNDEDIEMETRHSHHIIEDDSDDDENHHGEEVGDSDDEDDGKKQHKDEDGDGSIPPPLITVAEATAVAYAVHVLREQSRAEVEEEEEAADTPYESDAETVASDEDDDEDDGDSDRDWEDVIPDVWNADVALIRSILPHVHVEDCVDMLRKHNGNLEAALNELTDL